MSFICYLLIFLFFPAFLIAKDKSKCNKENDFSKMRKISSPGNVENKENQPQKKGTIIIRIRKGKSAFL